jgi:hypothetical protein
MSNITSTRPKLVRVYCGIRHTSRGSKCRYIGHFEDGIRRQLRESFNTYVSVAQVDYGHREEFVFSSKPTVKLSPGQRRCAVAEVHIGLDTAEGR